MKKSSVERLYPAETAVTLNGARRKAMADQITTASRNRLKRQMGTLAQEDVDAVARVARLQLGL
jgi:mRNA interferase MazF